MVTFMSLIRSSRGPGLGLGKFFFRQLNFLASTSNLAPILCGENKSTHVGRGDAIVMKAATAPQRVKGNSTGLTVREAESGSKGKGGGAQERDAFA